MLNGQCVNGGDEIRSVELPLIINPAAHLELRSPNCNIDLCLFKLKIGNLLLQPWETFGPILVFCGFFLFASHDWGDRQPDGRTGRSGNAAY